MLYILNALENALRQFKHELYSKTSKAFVIGEFKLW